MREDDERRREGRLLFVLHDDTESIELPNLVREGVGVDENRIEDGYEQVEQQDVGHQQVAGHQQRVEPAAGHAHRFVFVAAVRVDLSCEQFAVDHEVRLEEDVPGQ